MQRPCDSDDSTAALRHSAYLLVEGRGLCLVKATERSDRFGGALGCHHEQLARRRSPHVRHRQELGCEWVLVNELPVRESGVISEVACA